MPSSKRRKRTNIDDGTTTNNDDDADETTTTHSDEDIILLLPSKNANNTMVMTSLTDLLAERGFLEEEEERPSPPHSGDNNILPTIDTTNNEHHPERHNTSCHQEDDDEYHTNKTNIDEHNIHELNTLNNPPPYPPITHHHSPPSHNLPPHHHHLHNYYYRISTGSKGRGLFAIRSIPPYTLIHMAPCILISRMEYEMYMRYTVLEHYLFNCPGGMEVETMEDGSNDRSLGDYEVDNQGDERNGEEDSTKDDGIIECDNDDGDGDNPRSSAFNKHDSGTNNGNEYAIAAEESRRGGGGGDKLLALGDGSLFNHDSLKPNVIYTLDRRGLVIRYTTGRRVERGEELCIHYGNKLWFDDKGEEDGCSHEDGDEDDDGVGSEDGSLAEDFLNRMNL